ncbi:MAG: amino acid ABC transporter substrate-binding protein [Epsilonproteobacteria bacterium]|nr:amino acid ABC transporter substrate-binding protein [Campylobacterota bacterium]
MFIKKIGIPLVVFGLGAVVSWSTLSNNKDPKSLVVGVMSGYEPFACLDNQGALYGFDIDIADELSKRLGRKLVFKDLNVAGLLLALEQGKIDILLSGLSITPERERKIEMIYYQGSDCTTYPLVFWGKIPDGITSLDDLVRGQNAVVCVEPGSCQEKYLLDNNQRVTTKTVPVMSDIVLELRYGKASAALLDPDILPGLRQKNSELVSLDVTLPIEYQSRGCGIGINKQNTMLIKSIGENIANMLRDGTIAQIEQKWFGFVTVAGRGL